METISHSYSIIISIFCSLFHHMSFFERQNGPQSKLNEISSSKKLLPLSRASLFPACQMAEIDEQQQQQQKSRKLLGQLISMECNFLFCYFHAIFMHILNFDLFFFSLLLVTLFNYRHSHERLASCYFPMRTINGINE